MGRVAAVIIQSLERLLAILELLCYPPRHAVPRLHEAVLQQYMQHFAQSIMWVKTRVIQQSPVSGDTIVHPVTRPKESADTDPWQSEKSILQPPSGIPKRKVSGSSSNATEVVPWEYPGGDSKAHNQGLTGANSGSHWP